MRRAFWVWGLGCSVGLALTAVSGCGGGQALPKRVLDSKAPSNVAPTPPAPFQLSVIGTNDMHGAVERLPLFAGYVDSLREQERGNRELLLLDAGDIFQGSLESNLGEGDVMIQAMNRLGYRAAAVGNHEFDFGPVGEARTGDPQGALRARIAEADFPFLAANLFSKGTRQLPEWKNLEASTLIEVHGVKIGLVGLSTPETPNIVLPAYLEGLDFQDPLPIVTEQAARLRGQGADVVIVTAHIGGSCTRFEHAQDLSSCDMSQEAMELLQKLEPGLVDVFIGGHTHKAVAHEVNGVALVESFSKLEAFSRVDLTLQPPGNGEPARLLDRQILPPQRMCDDASGLLESCKADEYAGRRVTPASDVQAMIQPALARAKSKREQPLGIEVRAEVTRGYDKPSALGNLFADLTLLGARQVFASGRPEGADVAVANGGGLRANLPAGPLTYGSLFNAMPFDNLIARVRLTGAQLAQVIASHMQRSGGGILSVAGVDVSISCHGDTPEVQLRRPGGKLVRDEDVLWLALSDYLATGGDGLFKGVQLAKDAVEISPDVMLRDAMADALGAWGKGGKAPALSNGRLDPSKLFDPKRLRIQRAERRPVCP
ncbi:MAG: bifunctional metallophosphatase/5'-nucleotidase [Myxococcales bacterium]|nr:bifunctional metallophosphatase/5'-nucleotidase [Myxococcales bacterium]